MAPLPDATLTILDGALGLELPPNASVHAIVGPCAGGTANTVYAFTDRKTALGTLLGGPAFEAAAYSIQQAGGPVLVCPVTQTTPGAPGSVVQVGTGPALTLPVTSAITATGTAPPTITLTGTPLQAANIVVNITTGGILATAQYKISYDGGKTFSATAATAASVVLTGLGAGLTLTFPAGTYTNDNVYTAATCVPYDGYELIVKIVTGGTLGTAVFQLALDGLNPAGPTYGPLIATPLAASPVYVVPGTGIAITFAAGTYVAGNTYSSACVAPAYSNAGMAAAIAALLANPTTFAFVHVVGQAASVTLSAAQAVALDAAMTSAQTAYRYTAAIMECAADTDANIATNAAFLAFSSVRTGVGVGFGRLISASTGPTGGMTLSRSSAWVAAARASAVKAATDIAEVDLGPVGGITSISRDENATPLLDAARFITLRTITGKQGYFITNGRLMAPNGSDYLYLHYRRVMDIACTIARADALQFLNKDLLTTATGTIDEVQARNIESAIGSDLTNQLVKPQPRQAQRINVVVGRTNVITQDQTLNITINVQPLAYGKFIGVTIGFVAAIPAT